MPALSRWLQPHWTTQHFHDQQTQPVGCDDVAGHYVYMSSSAAAALALPCSNGHPIASLPLLLCCSHHFALALLEGFAIETSFKKWMNLVGKQRPDW